MLISIAEKDATCPKKVARAFFKEIPEVDRKSYLSLSGKEMDSQIYENFFPIVSETLKEMKLPMTTVPFVAEVCNHIRDLIKPFNYTQIYMGVKEEILK